MHKKSLNIAALCMVALLVSFVVTRESSSSTGNGSNIAVNTNAKNGPTTSQQMYQQEILKTVFEQNVKSFESVSESFKKKPTDTLTETISKNIFSQYLEYNTSKSLDVDVIQAETVAALKNHPAQKSNITLQDIKISGNTVKNLRDYVNTVGLIQTELAKSIQKIEKKQNAHVYIKNLYKTTADIYLRITVPESVSKEHIGIINGYRNYSSGFQLLELQSKDPAKALTGVQLAKEGQDGLVESFSSIKKIVQLNKITFTPGEHAYIWFLESQANEQIKIN